MAEEVKVSGKSAEIIEAIKVMTVIELAELVKALQSEFGVSAAPMMAASEMGVSRTRSGPKRSHRPTVAPKPPPL